jgi:site-specific recombinase XerD
VSAHALRHTAASDVLDRCKDLRIVQQMLGHQHLATTAIYLRRASLVDMRTAMEGRRYEPGASGS